MSVPQLFQNFKKVVKIHNIVEKAIIDNSIFRLHYRATTIAFLTCSLFVTAYTMFGDPIQCIGDTKDGGVIKVVNTYCYLGYTYTLLGTKNVSGATPDELEKTFGIGVPNDMTKQFHNYYRWVPLMLFLQGILFYAPHWIWKQWENKQITLITKGVRGPIVQEKDEDVKRIQLVAKYAFDSLHTHNSLALMYYFCEVLNLINVFFNMFLIDTFLDGEFTRYGLKVLQFTFMDQEDRLDPMIKTFPRITKCDFRKVGASGGIQNFDYMCVLALNNVNEKIYIFLWFWLYLLALISILPIFYNFAVLICPSVREKTLGTHYVFRGREDKVEKIIEEAQIGDYFLYQLFAKNMSSKYFREFIDELYNSLLKNKPKKGAF